MKTKVLPVTVPFLDVEKYSGLWHRIASIPFKWEEGCVSSTAKYRALKNGNIKVVNTCYLPNGKSYSRNGVAYSEECNFNEMGKLTVDFNDGMPSDGAAPYWVHYTDYNRFSVVGSPSGQFLWILGRDTSITKYELDNLMIFIGTLGYNTSKIKLAENAKVLPSE